MFRGWATQIFYWIEVWRLAKPLQNLELICRRDDPPLDRPYALWKTLDRPVYVLAKAGGPFEHCGILIHDNIESCKV